MVTLNVNTYIYLTSASRTRHSNRYKLLHRLTYILFCTMHNEMSDFESINLHCFVAPGSLQIALKGTATSLDEEVDNIRLK